MKGDSGRDSLTAIVERLSRSESLTIVGLGDSLTYGWMVRQGFFDRFIDALEKLYLETKITRINAGIPGDTAHGGLRRITGVLSHTPDIMIVQFALNDAFVGVGPSAFGDSLRSIAHHGLRAGALPVLATSCPLVVSAQQRLVDTYYGAIREIGSELEIPVADLERHWRSAISPGQQLDDLFLSDGVHPSDAGHQLMADGLLALFSMSCAPGTPR